MSMPRSPENEARLAEASRLHRKEGETLDNAARAVGMSRGALQHYIQQQKAAQDTETALSKECASAGIRIDDVSCYWYKNENISILVRQPHGPSYDDYRKATIAEMQGYAPVYKRREADPSGDHMVILTAYDLHLGKWCDIDETGHAYNIEEAVERARKGTDELIAKCRLHGVKAFVLVLGNDILHIDSPRRTTTSGTPQDTDGTIFTMFQAGKRLLIATAEQLALEADVHLMHVMSNHDWVSGWMLADTIGSWFHNHPNVHAGDLSPRHRKYLTYGSNLIGLTHGDGAKEKDLHWHMANEAAEMWSKTIHRYWLTGHQHHKRRRLQGADNAQIEKDHIGFTEIVTNLSRDPARNVHIEVVRSPSPPDGWHDRNGYTARPAMEAYLHHPLDGQVARFTHFF